LLLGFMVEYGPPVADGVVPGDARHVILQRRPGPDKGGPGELSSPYTGPGGFCGLGTGKFVYPASLELRGFINVGAMMQRRRERQWHRENLQLFEENLRLPIGAEEEDFDFLGIRWMQDGR
ncbi:hypothetical protein PV326_000121, partial [Microctonus aethiopoides]